MTTTFKDRTGHAWDVAISYAAALRIESLDLSALGIKGPVHFIEPDQDLFTAHLTRPAICLAFVWAIVKPQADTIGLTQDQWCDRLGGHEIVAARHALWDAVADFFPERATSLSRLWQEYKTTEAAITAKAGPIADRLRVAMDRVVDEMAAAAIQEIDGARLGTASITAPPS